MPRVERCASRTEPFSQAIMMLDVTVRGGRVETLRALSLQTAVALRKLGELQQRAERVAAGQSGLVRPALEELSSSLEELKVANEHLERQVVELTAARVEIEDVKTELNEVLDVMPTPSLFTDAAGVISEANPATAALLNVPAATLRGNPLLLFVVNRQSFFDVLANLAQAHDRTFRADLIIRPREHRPRRVSATVRRLSRGQCFWFMAETATAQNPSDDLTPPLCPNCGRPTSLTEEGPRVKAFTCGHCRRLVVVPQRPLP
jgi:PAS domain-containing protein